MAHAPPVCPPAALAAAARFLRVGRGAVTSSVTTSSEATPECDLRVRSPRVGVAVLIDNGPQPYFRLERTAVEASQQFGLVRSEPLPNPVSGLGIDAWWFPGERRLMTTDGKLLITVNVDWAGVSQARRRALGIATADAFLGKSRAKAAVGYPSG